MEGAVLTPNVNALQRGLEPQARDPLKAATEEFEGMFLSYLLKVMRSTVDSEDDGELSMGKEIYTEMFDSEIALSIARTRSLGIGEMMYRQLQESGRTSAVDPIPPQPAVEEAPDDDRSPSAMSVPVDGRLSSGFGLRMDPITGSPQFHKGIDLAAPEGTPFRAASGGTVVFAGMLNGYGNTVIIEHGNGSRTLYGHASQILVHAGDVVNPNQEVGLIGKTGRSTGPHLHFEASVGGQQLDPRTLIAAKDSDKVHSPIHR